MFPSFATDSGVSANGLCLYSWLVAACLPAAFRTATAASAGRVWALGAEGGWARGIASTRDCMPEPDAWFFIGLL